MKNKLHLDFANNPDLAEIFARKKAGEKCTLEVSFQISSVDEKSVTGTITKVSSEEYEKEAEPAPDEPMAMEMNAPMPMKKGMKSKMEDNSPEDDY